MFIMLSMILFFLHVKGRMCVKHVITHTSKSGSAESHERVQPTFELNRAARILANLLMAEIAVVFPGFLCVGASST